MSIYERFKGTDLEGYVIDDFTPSEIWHEYEKRKRKLRERNPTTKEYDEELQKIIKELGL